MICAKRCSLIDTTLESIAPSCCRLASVHIKQAQEETLLCLLQCPPDMQLVAKVTRLFSIEDMDIFIDFLSPLVIDMICRVKFLACVLKITEIRALFERIQDDWRALSIFLSAEILNSYARNGRKFTIYGLSKLFKQLFDTQQRCVIYIEYNFCHGNRGKFFFKNHSDKLNLLETKGNVNISLDSIYSTLILFMLVLLQLLLFSSLNNTIQPLSHKVEYHIDMDYYFPILLHGYITDIIYVIIASVTDTMHVIMMQHVCRLFVIIGHQMRSVTKERNLTVDIKLIC